MAEKKKNPFTEAKKNPFATGKSDDQLRKERGQITIGGKTKALPGAPLSIMQTVQAPQQVALRAIKGVGEAATGDFGAGVREVGKGLTELGSLGQARGDISVTEALSPLGVKKLPFGLETVGQIVTDPTTYLTLGAGSVGRTALKATEDVLGAGARQAVRKGGLKALTKTEQEAVRKSIFETAAKDIGEKKAAKVADAQMQALKSRAKGGAGLHIPGTKIDARLPLTGHAEKGPLASLIESSPTASKAAKIFTGTDVVAERAREAAQPRLFDIEDLKPREPLPAPKGGAAVQAAEETPTVRAVAFEKIHKNLDRLAEKPHSAPGTIAKAWRRAAVTYPGTVINRLRQAAFYGAAAGMRPDQWMKNMERGRKAYTAAEKLAKEMGLEADELIGNADFAARLEKKIGPQAAKEELAFRQYAEEPTIFKNIEGEAPRTKIGKVAEKGRLVKKGGKKIREAGNAVEEASRRAHFLHYAESRYGSFEEAGRQTKYFMPGVKTMSVAEAKLQRVMPFWTAIRADAQAVLRQAGESPGRVSALTQLGGQIGGTAGLPGGGTFDFGQLQERHMPPLELAKLLNIPLDAAKGDLNSALLAISEMTGGAEVAALEQVFDAWKNRNRGVATREQGVRFLKAVSPYLNRLPTSVEKFLAGDELSDKDKSAMEALLQVATGLKAQTGEGEELTAEQKKSTNPFSSGGKNPFAPK